MQTFTFRQFARARAAVVAGLGVLALSLAGVLPVMKPALAAPKSSKPTVVLVHGAFADSGGWNGAIARLLAKGYPVLAVANPLRSVKGDAAYVGKVLDSIKGPVVLVGHSYGGNVISAAAIGRDNVKALVYVAGFAPETGETAAALNHKFPGSRVGESLAPPVVLEGGGKDLYIARDKFRAEFAADLPIAETTLLAATQRPVTEAALNEPAGSPAWKTIPSWFLYGSLDNIIPRATHAFMAQRAGARKVVEVSGASHVVMISHPDALAKLVEEASAATTS